LSRDEPLYLDHNAGSPLRAEALDAMLPLLRGPRSNANPSSIHLAGQAAHAALDEARASVAASLGGWPEEWVFTSGATEACNLALKGLAAAGRPLLAGATEHPAVLETALALKAAGTAVEVLPVETDGRVDRKALKEALARHPGAAVALMAANNETGVCNDIAALTGIVRAAGGLLFCDLAQALGKLAVDVRALDVDLAAASAVKYGGPQGSGLLYVRKGLDLKPLLQGGHQESGRRPGTENLAGAAGSAAALAAATAALGGQAAAWERGIARLESGLRRLLPTVHVHGAGAPRVPNTLSVSLPGVDRDLLLLRVDQLGLRISAGAACAAGANTPSHVLQAMGVAPDLKRSALRFSLGPDQGEDAADDALRRLAAALEGLRKAGLAPGP